MKYKTLIVSEVLAVLLLAHPASLLAGGATNLVTSTADSGAGSLRQAILDANADATSDPVVIHFDIAGGGVQTIAPLSGLPYITRPLTIDGYTQPGASVNTLANSNDAVLLVELSGAAFATPSYGLRIQASGCTVRGLVINAFSNNAYAIIIENSTNSVVEGNFISTDATGTNVVQNRGGILVRTDSTGTRIGGTTPAARNIIAGEEAGVDLEGGTHLIVGNFIGVGADGRTKLGSGYGIFLSSCIQTEVGGSAPGARNVISGNGNGCLLAGGSNNVIRGNFIGTDATGTLPQGNRQGLVLVDSAYNLVGGDGPGEGNLISANGVISQGSGGGVIVNGAGSSNNVFLGNLIGTDIGGLMALTNFIGIEIVGGPGNRIGGTTPGARNILSGNTYAVDLEGAEATEFQGNYVGLGLDGTTLVPNLYGLLVNYSSRAHIGGPNPAARNIFSGNSRGCWINTSAASSNVVQGNFFGTDVSGMLARSNATGLFINESCCNTIGGTNAGEGNLFSASFSQGLAIQGAGASNNLVLGNLVGTDVTGTNALGNYVGVGISGGGWNLRVGGLSPGARNILSGNQYALDIEGAGGSEVFGNYMGLGIDGATAVPNTFGMYLSYAVNVRIGGSAPGARNVMSANAIGLYANTGGSNVIQGNYFGTDASGRLAMGNQTGIAFNESSHNLIGGTAAGEGNVFAAISSAGVSINGDSARTNFVIGNLFGTDATGTNALPGGNYGIYIGSGSGNVIGGTAAGSGNVISGADLQGIAIYSSAGNVIQGNSLGTDITGIQAISNKYAGILFVNSSGNFVGGTASGAQNLIAYSALAAVAMAQDGSTNNAVLGNSMFAIGGIGIDLGYDGATPNDAGDADGGPNHLQNTPQLTTAVLVGGGLALRYQVDSATANSAYPLTIEVFRATAGGNGRTLLDRHVYNTPQLLTNVAITPLAPLNDGDLIVATATDIDGNTSEFSAAVTAAANHAPFVQNPVPNQSGSYGLALNYSFPANTFQDPDAGDTLSYTASGLPPGIVFVPATRTFNGTPTAAGTYSVTVTATDNGVPSLSTNGGFDIVVAKGSLTASADNKSRLQGQANPTLTGSLVGVVNSDNITATFATTATPASPPGSYPITPVLSDPGARLANYTMITNAGTLTVVNCSTLSINNGALANATRGAAYSVTLTAANGGAPYAFAVTSGTLPASISLAPGGLLSGTASATGGSSFTITATDTFGCTVSSNYTLTVVCPNITVSPASAPNGTRGVAYSQTLSGSGGTAPYSFAVTSGSLPTGVSLSSAGALTGTPTVLGSSSFTVTATDAGGCTGTKNYAMNVVCPTLVLAPASLPAATKDLLYGANFSTTGGTAPYTYAVSSGTLPTGLTMTSGGAVSGTPTVAGSSTFTIQSTDAGNCTVSVSYTLSVETPVYEGFGYASGNLLDGQNGGAGFSTAWAGSSSFGIQPGSYSVGGPSSGNHVATGNGSYTRRLTQTIGAAGTVRYLSFFLGYVLQPGPHNGERVGLVLNGTSGPGLFVGKPGTGSEFSWVLENAAGGSAVVGPSFFPAIHAVVLKCEFFAGNDRFTLYVDPVAGQPEPATGTVKFNTDVGTITNIGLSVSGFTLPVCSFDEIRVASTYAGAFARCPAITINPASLPGGALGIAYSQTVTASGSSGPFTFSVSSGALPGGLSLSSGGLISGTPNSAGNYSFFVAAGDAAGCQVSLNYSINIPCPAITVSPGTLPDGIRNTPYSQTLTASGGTAPYSFSIFSGALPSGLTLSASGVLSGTVANNGVSSVTFQVIDATSCSVLTNYLVAFLPNRWVGDGAANQWNLSAPNWKRGLFHNNEEALFDDIGSNNVPVNITTTVSPSALLLDATRPITFTGAGGVSGTGSVSKSNSGEIRMGTSNSYSGLTVVSGGRLTVRHNNALGTTNGATITTNTGGVYLDGNGLTVPEPLALYTPIVTAGTCNPTNVALVNLANSNTWSGPITLGLPTGSGAFIRSDSGLLTLSSATPISGPGVLNLGGEGNMLITSTIGSDVPAIFKFGGGTAALTGTNLSTGGVYVYCDGTLAALPRSLGSGQINAGSGTLEIRGGGSVAVNNDLRITGGGLRLAAGTSVTLGYPGVLRWPDDYFCRLETMSAGDTLTINPPISGDFYHGYGTIYVTGPGTVVVNSGLATSGPYLGYWNLTSGILRLNNVDALGSRKIIYLDGGALQSGVNAGGVFANSVLLNGPATIQPGRSSSGAGVSNYFGDLSLRGYSLTVRPGANLTAGSTADLGFGLTYIATNSIIHVQNSGGTNARVTLMDVVRELSDPAILSKSGDGTLVLLAANTHRGGVTVSNGLLRVANTGGSATGTGPVNVLNGATLAGTGRIAGAVTIGPGATIAPGDSIGVLTISNQLVLKAGSTNLMEVNLSTATNDVLARLTSITYGGTLVLSRLGAQVYGNGNAFKLFDAANYSGVFAALQPSTPGAGLQWNISTLAVDGKLRVITGANQWPVVANPIPDQNASYGVAFNLTLAANTFTDPDAGQSLSYTAFGMPPGILFNPSTRTFSGSTTARGTFDVTVIATDNGPSPLSTSDTFNITVPQCPVVALSPSGPLPQPTTSSAYSQPLSASGGVAPYQFTVTSGTLPSGLNLSPSGVLGGVPTVSGYFQFSVTARDAENCTGSTNYSIFVKTNGPGTIAMIARRNGHTASLLPNDQVLVAGGYDENYVARSSCELYNPATGRWLETAPMSSPRTGHRSTLLPNGKVLVTGGNSTGNSANDLASAELYNPATGAWTNTGSMSATHRQHTATLLANGKVLVTGGYNNDPQLLARAELYDPSTETWTVIMPLHVGRYSHTATLLLDGRVLVAGGQTYVSEDGPDISSTEFYDPTTEAWTTTTPLGTAREWHTATLLTDGTVLVAGGYKTIGNVHVYSAERFDPLTETWMPAGVLTAARSAHTSTLLMNGMVLVAGGETDGFTSLSSMNLYNPLDGTWAPTTSLTTGRAYGTATLLPNSQVLLAGGYGATALDSSELYGTAQVVIHLAHATKPPGGAVQFDFTGASGTSFTVFGTTDVSLPIANWTLLGPATEVSPGQFQFSDPQSITGTRRFYRVRSP